MSRAHDCHDHRRLHRRRRGHRRLLRSAHWDKDDQNRISNRAHTWQLPFDVESRPADSVDWTSAVKDLVFTARLIGAEEATSIGLLNEVVEDVPALERRVEELANLIAGNAPLTLSATKQALARLQHRLSREEGEDLILMCYMSRDFREGLDSFLNKRRPQWAGE
jgi:enoyl-CoA hydratase/carnithine racemase